MSNAEDPRTRHVERVRQRLNERGNPHWHVFLILCFTGLAGFLTSAALREMGLRHYMGVRYLIAVGAAYLAFLAMLGLWIAASRGRRRASSTPVAFPRDDGGDLIYIADGMHSPGIDVGADLAGESSSSGDSGSSGGGISGLGDLGDGEGVAIIVVLLVVVAILAAVFASVWVLIEAPLLLAELIVDGALIAGMARRLRARNADQHWTATAIRRTWVPFLITAAAFTFVNFGLQMFVPEATTMLEAIKLAVK